MVISLLAYVISGLILPNLFWVIPTTLISLMVIISSGMRIIAICLSPPKAPETLDDGRKDWPTYTVLVPIYREAHMVETLMNNLSALDYPRDKLQILMICEADDHETVETVKTNLRKPFELVSVLPSQPRTKPKAMNVAMERATGELITIYDAEDRPHPKQLKAAVRMLEEHPEWAAVQAPLGYFNYSQNWLTRQFTLEYATLFHVMNPFMVRMGLPFPLGGTSNHFRRSALEQVGGWDPHNVTEDADLSFRFVAYGWKVGMMNYTTLEEAVSHPANWVFQRTRWIKGFMQSWAVHVREPMRGGWRRALALQLSLGLTLITAFLHVPAIIIVSGLALAAGLGVWSFPSEWWIYAIAVFGYAGPLLAGLIACFRADRKSLIPHIIFMPIYWLGLFLPAIKATIQLIRNPFYWNKTRHGDSRGVSLPAE